MSPLSSGTRLRRGSCVRGFPSGARAAPRSSTGTRCAFSVARGHPFDIVFLDPPFDSDFLTLAADRLENGGWLAPGALIYVECPARTGLPPLPPTWTATKAKQAGEVGYHLLTR